MTRSRKSNRVSWAPDPHLRQVKRFLSDDCPSEVTVPAKEHIFRKQHSQRLEHSKGQKANDLPPGFESMPKFRKVNQEAPRIPKIEWSCPPRFVMKSEWQVAAGEESKESNAQKLREMRVLKVMHPRLSTSAHSLYLPSGVEAEHWDDSLTPVVPLEEVAADVEPNSEDSSNPPASSQTSRPTQNLNSLGMHNPVSEPLASQNSALPYSVADLVTALAVIVKNTEQSDLIDTDLLVKIFSDPEMIQNLINSYPAAVETAPPTVAPKPYLIPPECGTPIPATSLAPTSVEDDKSNDVPSWMKPTSKPGMTSIPALAPLPGPARPAVSSQFLHGGMALTLQPCTVPVPEMKHVSLPIFMPPRQVSENFPKPGMVQPAFINVPLQPYAFTPNASPNHHLTYSNGMPTHPNIVYHAPMGAAKIDTMKDMNYVKNLIGEHGANKQQNRQFGTHNIVSQNMELTHNLRPEVEPKFQKPCLFFTKPAGCRNGSNCPFKHETSVQLQTGNVGRAPSAMKMKFGGEIEGR